MENQGKAEVWVPDLILCQVYFSSNRVKSVFCSCDTLLKRCLYEFPQADVAMSAPASSCGATLTGVGNKISVFMQRKMMCEL